MSDLVDAIAQAIEAHARSEGWVRDDEMLDGWCAVAAWHPIENPDGDWPYTMHQHDRQPLHVTIGLLRQAESIQLAGEGDR